jgi:hypothetical protein
LRKKKEVKRVKDSSREDYQNIQKLRKEGWEYCSKSIWRKLSGKTKEKAKEKKKESPRPSLQEPTVMGLTQHD